MSEVVEFANTIRTTHNTVTNETSSRSHAICNIVIKEKDERIADLKKVNEQLDSIISIMQEKGQKSDC